MRFRANAVGEPPWFEKHELVVVAAVSAALLLGWLALGTVRTGLFKDDAAHYARLAESIADPVRLPYTFRVLTPWLVGLLPLELTAAFTLLTGVALWAAGVLLFALMRLTGYGPLARWAALGLFLNSGLVVRALTTPLYVDALTDALLAVAVILLVRGHDGGFAIVTALGTLNRETALLLLPSYVAARWPPVSSAAWLRLVSVCGTPLLVLGTFILWKLVSAGLLSLGPSVVERLDWVGPRQRVPQLGDLMDVYSLFGVAWLVAAANARHLRPPLRPLWIFSALVCAQLLIARGDEGRVLGPLFVLVLPLAAVELERIGTLRIDRRWRLTMCGLLVVACLSSMVHARWAWIPSAAVRYGLVTLGTLVGIAVIVANRWLAGRCGRLSPAGP